MASTSEIGASIIEAAASGDLNQLKAIKKKVGDEWEFRKICDQYSDFSTGWTVMHHAAEIGHFEMCKFLIKNVQVSVDPFTYKRDTPIAQAAKGEHVQIVEFLIEHDAIISLPNVEGFTACTMHFLQGLSPLSAAARDRDTKFLKSLLAAKANPNLYEEDIFKPIEEAAMVRNRAAMEILFPMTKRLAHYPDWTIDGIIKCIHSEEIKAMGEEKMRNVLNKLDIKGMYFAYNNDYKSAVIQYRKATNLRPGNTTFISKLGMCVARLSLRIYALLAARKCIGLMPELPVLFRGEIDASANVIFKKFLMAALAFSLDPYNKDAGHLFRVALFDYFVWLTQMSSSDEILSLS